MNKKIIFIGGSAYSGSTFLDLVLANSPDGFSCGEVRGLFYRRRRHHINIKCGCGNPKCSIWDQVKKAGVANLYRTIFEIHPEVEFIVDSSKDPIWMHDRTREVASSGIEVKNVLIWKTPEEFLYSRIKRNQEKGWKRAWVNSHWHYFSMMDEWYAVQYGSLVRSPEVLRKLCDRLDILYFEGKERYWEKVHHTLFGNTSAKIHLYDKKSTTFEEHKTLLKSKVKTLDNAKIGDFAHQAVYYEDPTLAKDPKASAELWEDKTIKPIISMLHATDIFADPGREIFCSFKLKWYSEVYMKLLRCFRRLIRPLQSMGIKFYEMIT
jgi:hypothetical protein